MTDADGRFVLAGLVPGSWRMRVFGLLGMPCHCVVANEDGFAAVQAEVPGDRVRLEFRLCRVELVVQLDGKPVAQAPLSIQGTSPDGDSSVLGGRTDADGRFRYLALPGCKYQTWVERADVEEVTPAFFLADDDIERVVTLDLEHRRGRPSLALKLVDPSGAHIGRAWFQLQRLPGPDAWPREFRLEPTDDVSIRAARASTASVSDRARSSRDSPVAPLASDDSTIGDAVPQVGPGTVFLIKEIEPGSYRVLVRAGGGYHGCGGCFQEEAFDVALLEPVLVERSIELRPTGRLRVFARDARGEGVCAKFEVLTPDGHSVPAVLTFEADHHSGASGGGRIFSERPGFVTPPPAPGRYALRFSADGFATQTIEIEVIPGETTEVMATLERL